jgi:Flp pilus assembly protein TadD
MVLAYLADARLLEAVNADYAGRNRDALVPAQQARMLGPRESVYAVEVGNVMFERSDWASAREAYIEAAALGTYNRVVYRNLALADRNLGRLAEAREAARQAVALDRFDAANLALLASLTNQQS